MISFSLCNCKARIICQDFPCILTCPTCSFACPNRHSTSSCRALFWPKPVTRRSFLAAMTRQTQSALGDGDTSHVCPDHRSISSCPAVSFSAAYESNTHSRMLIIDFGFALWSLKRKNKRLELCFSLWLLWKQFEIVTRWCTIYLADNDQSNES